MFQLVPQNFFFGHEHPHFWRRRLTIGHDNHLVAHDPRIPSTCFLLAHDTQVVYLYEAQHKLREPPSQTTLMSCPACSPSTYQKLSVHDNNFISCPVNQLQQLLSNTRPNVVSDLLTFNPSEVICTRQQCCLLPYYPASTSQQQTT